MSKRKDLTGMKFGKLTVIRPTRLILKRTRYRKGLPYEEYIQEYECLCDCGNKKISLDQVLKSITRGRGVGSCGCAHRKDKVGNGQWSVAFNIVWKNYVCHSAVKNRVFDLTKEQFKELTSSNCYYCGSEPSTVCKSKSKKHPSQYVYNGIDRVDNNKDYIVNNCVPCCEMCNRMKLDDEQETFLARIKKIYDKLINTVEENH